MSKWKTLSTRSVNAVRRLQAARRERDASAVARKFTEWAYRNGVRF